MASMLPASVFGLRVPAGGIPIPGTIQFPASFRITMAAIDPTAEAQFNDHYKVARATLKIIRELRAEDGDSDDDFEGSDDDIEAIKARLAGIISDEDEDMSDEDDEDDSEDEKNGGPSDPTKAVKAMQVALTKKLQEELDADEMEDVKQLANGLNGIITGKGKGRALDDDMGIDDEAEEFVVCTLDPEKQYQQPLDITVGEHEQVYFQVNGTHDIYLTGNYVLPPDDMSEDEDGDDDDYDSDGLDLPLDEDELDEMAESDDDELDGLGDPRITEIDSDEEKAPKLVEQRTGTAAKKGKNKRPAESLEAGEEAATLDELIGKTKAAGRNNSETNGDAKQAKKLKGNNGQAVAAAQESTRKEASNSDKKKVQFAKNLEQGPTGSPKVEEGKKRDAKKEPSKTGPKNVQGVTIDEKKVGQGRSAKKGDRIEMRYIGKLKNGKQFDANKKGKPSSFKLGTGEVIKGWDIGVAGMAAGGERRLTIPAKLGYGNKSLPDIPANSELVFDIKCISVS